MNKLIILLILGIWSGLVLGLSFIEAPLKFQAPGMTTNLGLGIGRLVFGVLNKIEIGFALILVITHLGLFKKMATDHFLLFTVPIVIVLAQTLWLLPALDHRAELILTGKAAVPSNDHLYYVVMEVVKLTILIFQFIKTYKSFN